MEPLFLGHHPLIDFLNTSLAPGGEHVEMLVDGKAYLNWLVSARLVNEQDAAGISKRFGAKALDAAATEARKLRDWMREWVGRWRAHPRGNYAQELATLNKLLARSSRSTELVGTKGEYQILESHLPDSAAALIGLVALELAKLLAGERPEFIKACAGPSCTLWFVDRTKSHRRLFCSATVCGNRAKVAAFRERHRT